MKRTIRILSYIGLAIATTALIVLFSSSIPLPQSNNAVALAKPFNDFPPDKPQFIDYRLDELSFEQLTKREKQDQLRDWLLFTIVSDKDLSTEEINQSLYDVSTTRQGYMRPVSNFEYGMSRSLYVGEGEVVALIPAKLKADQRNDALAHIADKHRKDLGEKPTNLLVFEYELNSAEQYAWLTRREVIDAEKLFTSTANYTESTVSTLVDFQAFMGKVDDLTYARLDGNQLILGGRKIQGRPYKGIRVEDVATIWQSEEKIHADLAAFNAKWNARFNAAAPSQQSQIKEQAYAEMAELKLVNGSGFSLDPAYDYQAFTSAFNRISSFLSRYIAEEEAVIAEKDLQDAKRGLSSNNAVPYLVLVDKLETSNSPKAQAIGAYLKEGEQSFRFQQARYDGYLQGTEVGMVLFYTDLLAKLWVLDHQRSTSQKEVPDFFPLTTISSKIASIYKQEVEDLPSTRLWFGSHDKGFQTSLIDNSLLFARNATRIYAASSNPLRPGEETIAAANSEAFLGWWNDHYEEVAAYEPQYEQLNEIMKWSLMISWLNNAEQGNTLGFFKEIQVRRDFHFPDWAKAQGDRLRFKDWESVKFYPPSYLDTTTEAMEILESKPYSFFGNPNWRISGGVSLADEGLFQSRKALSSVDDLNSLTYRSTIDYGTVKLKGGQLNFKTLEGTAYRLFKQQSTLASVAVKAKEGSKLRGRLSELANLEIVRDVARTDDGLSINTFAGKTELGRLKTTRTRNGFDVGWRGRDIDDGQVLMHQISQTPDQSIESILNNHSMVALVAKPSESDSLLVKLHGADDWMQIATGGGGSNLPPEWQARVGSFPDEAGRSQNMLLRWVDDDQVNKQLLEKTAALITNNLPDDLKGLNSNEVIQTLKQRNYRKVTKQIADDPQRVHTIVRDHIKIELKIINELRQQKKTARALQRLDELIDTYGKQADLMLEKALLDMDRQRLSVQRIDPKGRGKTPANSREDFYAVINQILSRSDDNYHFKAVLTDDEVIYIQDSPSFNNVDPSTPINDAFPFGTEARAYRLESGSIGDAHIGSSGYDAPANAFLLTGSDSSNPNTFNLGNYSNFIGSGGEDAEENCEDPQDKTQCPRQVYVVIDETQL